MTGDDPWTVDRVLALDGFEKLDDAKALNRIGALVDLSDIERRADGVDQALAWCAMLGSRTVSSEQQALLHYYWANAWAARQRQRHIDVDAAWSWRQEEMREQIIHLRTALTSEGFGSLNAYRRCQILTNLANQLNTSGRFVEAQEPWKRALKLTPDFWMARGNRAYGLTRYAQSLFDSEDQALFLLQAHDEFSRALDDHQGATIAEPEEAPAMFESWRLKIAEAYDLDAVRALIVEEPPPADESREEGFYRRWVRKEGLFLNPLNDLQDVPVFGADALGLPSYVTGLDEAPVLIGFYNQMKQEFASARWLLYEAFQPDESHFSDRGVKLINTLDYPAYGLRLEKLKFAYRVAYSLFDKIAWFLNDYMKLGLKPHQAAFAAIWFKGPNGPLRPEFDTLRNLPFRGLFFLSRDLFEEGSRDTTEPDARELHEIRKHLEHKYLKVHEMGPFRRAVDGAPDPFEDTLCYSVGRRDFEAKALRLMKLARAALIYLSLGMYWEETRRRRERPKAVLSAGMTLDVIDDEWKS